MRSMKSLEENLFLKEQRIIYWEKYHKIPTLNELHRNSKINIRDKKNKFKHNSDKYYLD